MRHAYLIDPFKRAVTEVFITASIDSGQELAEIYALLHCSDIEQISPHKSRGDVLLVDELGKIRNIEQAYFRCRLYPHATLAGCALWVGVTRDGTYDNPICALDCVRDSIEWAVDASVV